MLAQDFVYSSNCGPLTEFNTPDLEVHCESWALLRHSTLPGLCVTPVAEAVWPVRKPVPPKTTCHPPRRYHSAPPNSHRFLSLLSSQPPAAPERLLSHQRRVPPAGRLRRRLQDPYEGPAPDPASGILPRPSLWPPQRPWTPFGWAPSCRHLRYPPLADLRDLLTRPPDCFLHAGPHPAPAVSRRQLRLPREEPLLQGPVGAAGPQPAGGPADLLCGLRAGCGAAAPKRPERGPAGASRCCCHYWQRAKEEGEQVQCEFSSCLTQDSHCESECVWGFSVPCRDTWGRLRFQPLLMQSDPGCVKISQVGKNTICTGGSSSKSNTSEIHKKSEFPKIWRQQLWLYCL